MLGRWGTRACVVVVAVVVLVLDVTVTVTVDALVVPYPRDAARQWSNPLEIPEIPIVFENDRVLVIDKPYGIAHHDRCTADGTVVPGILTLLRKQRQQQQRRRLLWIDDDDDDDDDDDEIQENDDDYYEDDDNERLYGVHRLDAVTSGILVFAKDRAMAGMLGRAFRGGSLHKLYVGLSAKRPRKKKQGWVRGRMAPARRGSWKLLPSSTSSSHQPPPPPTTITSQESDHNNYAATRFFTAGLGNVMVGGYTNDHDDDRDHESPPLPKTAMLFRPLTGRTHQIRVAARSVGLPILGDPRYEPKDNNNNKALTGTTATRTFLHAAALHVDLSSCLEDDDNNDNDDPPFGGLSLTVVSPPPFDDDLTLTTDSNRRGDELNRVFTAMIKKHCDCEPILSTWLNHHLIRSAGEV